MEEFCLDHIHYHTLQSTKNLTPLISASKAKKFLQNFSHAHSRFLKFSVHHGFSVYEPQGFVLLCFAYFIHTQLATTEMQSINKTNSILFQNYSEREMSQGGGGVADWDDIRS